MSFPSLSFDNDDSPSVGTTDQSTETAPLSKDGTEHGVTEKSLSDGDAAVDSSGSEEQNFSQLVLGDEGEMTVKTVVSQTSKKKVKSKKTKDDQSKAENGVKKKKSRSSSKEPSVKENKEGMVAAEKQKRRQSVEKKGKKKTRSKTKKEKSTRRGRSIDKTSSHCTEKQAKSRQSKSLERIQSKKPSPSKRSQSVEKQDLGQSSHLKSRGNSRKQPDDVNDALSIPSTTRSTTPSRRRGKSLEGFGRDNSDKSLQSKDVEDSDKSIKLNATPSRRRQRSIDRMKRMDSEKSLRSNASVSSRRQRGIQQMMSEGSGRSLCSSLSSHEDLCAVGTKETLDSEIDVLKGLLEEKGQAMMELANLIAAKEGERQSLHLAESSMDALELPLEEETLEASEADGSEESKKSWWELSPKTEASSIPEDAEEKSVAEQDTTKRAGRKIKFVSRESL
ncbi:MAG: hypothetical protein SGARI_000011 [Bacillariaceae sp.]